MASKLSLGNHPYLVLLILNLLKALIQPPCLVHAVSSLALVVTIFMGRENGDKKRQQEDDTCKLWWFDKSLSKCTTKEIPCSRHWRC